MYTGGESIQEKMDGHEIGMLMTNGEKRGTITRMPPDGVRVKNP